MYYISPLGQYDKIGAGQKMTIDAAMLLAEKCSLVPVKGTEGIYEKWAVWELENGLSWVRAIALMGKARWVEHCPCYEDKACKICLGIGWKETGGDRG